ncbi:chromate efflux transporter [Sediminitomix flava]|uniref:Chromate transporter n=1 Tax=Sediminitomix flava TaxID=379075 RepID=A0A315Z0H1_SEDFL|nr:chromate efflux transporter [Sediminitomix flava]PWJ35991.1 chromate transporter [Sediminitomix flava]
MDQIKEIFAVCFKLGCLAFGGPAAHIAMLEDEVIEKRKWMSREHFLDLVGATNLIPGPNSTQMVLHCGKERAGFLGLTVAGLAFILPATAMTLAFAWVYIEFGDIPDVAQFFYGIKPAVLAIIVSALIKLGKKALKNYQLGILGALAFGAYWFGLNEVIVILGTGLLSILLFSFNQKKKEGGNLKSVVPFLFINGIGSIGGAISAMGIFGVFLKIALVLYGSGYLLIAYLDAELVERLGWLTKSQLLDAIAIGQFTPGPLLTTATFVGYQLMSWQGALWATLGMFLPSFVLVYFLNPIVPKLRKHPLAGLFLDGVNIGAVALMLAVTVDLSIHTLVEWQAFVVAAVGAVLTFYWKKSALVTVAVGAVLGYVLLLF